MLRLFVADRIRGKRRFASCRCERCLLLKRGRENVFGYDCKHDCKHFSEKIPKMMSFQVSSDKKCLQVPFGQNEQRKM